MAPHSTVEPSPLLLKADDMILAEARELLRGRLPVAVEGFSDEHLAGGLEERARSLGVADCGAYLERLRLGEQERRQLLEALLIGVSYFFRDPLVFELIGEVLLPLLVERRRGGGEQLRLWSAGCATGEETFSLAILAREALVKAEAPWPTLVFGTDVDEAALRQARAGRYDRERLREAKLGLVERYFSERGGLYVVRDEIRAAVRFSWDDLLSEETFAPSESIFGELDLVLCRNVLIYMDRRWQLRVLGRLVRSLARGGFLVLGQADPTAGLPGEGLRVFDRRNRIYERL